MSTEIARRQAGTLAMPAGARVLGQRVKPIIRLGMGFKDPEKGFPRKTDHFTVRGDERAVAKFAQVYGEKPKSVKIMVPSELGLALDISYRSFIGGQEDPDGGRPLALGFTNFAPLGYVGGPDVLRVWKQDGSYAEVETLGLDELGKPLDEIANDLKIEVYATFTFTIPEVLGWGSFAAITSKGKKSADNLTFKLGQIYSAFGSKAPFAFDRDEPPMLVLKPDTAMIRFEDKKGEAHWGKTKIFALDIVVPESFDKMVDRLAKRQAEIAPSGPAAALYPQALEAGSTSSSDPEEADARQAAEVVSEQQGDRSSSEAEEGPSAAASDEPIEEGEFTAPASVDASHPDVIAATDAAELTFESGKYKGKTLREIADDPKGPDYIRWVILNWRTEGTKAKVLSFAKIYLPEVYESVQATMGSGS